MSWAVTVKVLKLQAGAIGSYALGSVFYSVMIVVLFERFIEQHRTFFEQYLNIVPRALLRLFNAGGDITTFGGWVGAEFLSFIWVVIVVAYLITSTSGALAKEIEDGTMELVLAYPVGRVGFFLSKVAALVIGLAVIVGATLLGLWGGALSQNLRVDAGAYVAVGALAMAFALSIAGYGFLFSAAASERAVAAGAAAGVTVVFYAMNFAAQTWDALKGLSGFTLFYYYQPEDALNLGRVDGQAVLLLLAVALLTTVAAGGIFRLRDVSG